jgi:hypothetical protein
MNFFCALVTLVNLSVMLFKEHIKTPQIIYESFSDQVFQSMKLSVKFISAN